MLGKIIAGILALIGAVSAFVAMLSLKRMERKHAKIEILKARQDAQAANQKRQAQLEEEITKVNEPLKDLGNSREDRENLAALLDE